MKELDALPIDAGHCRELLEEGELRCSSGGDDASAPAKSNRCPDGGRGLRGCRSCQRIVVVKYADDHRHWFQPGFGALTSYQPRDVLFPREHRHYERRESLVGRP